MNLEPYDIVKWLDTLLEAEASSIKRLAASMLLQTLEGRNHLKRLWREQPELIKQTYRYLSDECLENLIAGKSQANPSYSKEEFYPLAESCPFCDTSPENLTWVFGNLHLDCGHLFFKIPDTWYVVCENCGLQLESFSTEDTPPHIQIIRDQNE